MFNSRINTRVGVRFERVRFDVCHLAAPLNLGTGFTDSLRF